LAAAAIAGRFVFTGKEHPQANFEALEPVPVETDD
jgi:hypothetical protein